MELTDDRKAVLIKVLNLTTSDQDGEALTSIRMANGILKQASLTWEDVIGRLVCQHCHSEDSVDSMISTLMKKVYTGSWAHDFVQGLERSYRKNRKLTVRQMDTLKRLVKSINGNRN